MSKNTKLGTIPSDIVKNLDLLKESGKFDNRVIAFNCISGGMPEILKIETKRLPKSKKKEVVVFGRWRFEM